MRIVSALSRVGHPVRGIEEIASALDVATHGRPDFLALHFGVGLYATALHDAARSSFGPGVLHGGSSCLGVMGDALRELMAEPGAAMEEQMRTS